MNLWYIQAIIWGFIFLWDIPKIFNKEDNTGKLLLADFWLIVLTLLLAKNPCSTLNF